MTTIQNIIDDKIAEQVEVVRNNEKEIIRLESEVVKAKQELRELLELRGSSWKDATGFARIYGSSIRKAYDTQALDELIISDPPRYNWLLDYRKEVKIKSDVQVR